MRHAAVDNDLAQCIEGFQARVVESLGKKNSTLIDKQKPYFTLHECQRLVDYFSTT
jgi:hypothetical protein